MNNLVDKLLQVVREAKEENIALQGVCAVLLCEVALLSNNPRAKLDNMLTGLQGVGHGVSQSVQNRSMTAVIERISQMSEAALSQRGNAP